MSQSVEQKICRYLEHGRKLEQHPIRGFLFWDVDGTAYLPAGIKQEAYTGAVTDEVIRDLAGIPMSKAGQKAEYIFQILPPEHFLQTLLLLDFHGWVSVAYLSRRNTRSIETIVYAYEKYFGVPSLPIISVFGRDQQAKAEVLVGLRKSLLPLTSGTAFVLIDNDIREVAGLRNLDGIFGIHFQTFAQIILQRLTHPHQ